MVRKEGDRAELTRKDFVSDQEPRWCPGCGDYSVLAQTQKVLPKLGIPKEKIVFVSGIGCSSRFPYYMKTYGFHSIHGRAPTVATGIKVANPELSVWIVTGDGDALSIGGNHLMHAIRRNLGVKILLFNNRIYGLTKGQYSPTSRLGARTRSSPMGSIDYPLHPCAMALGAEGTFVARSLDTDPKHLAGVIEKAAGHEGAAFVEVFQNCNIFNDGAFDHLKERSIRSERMIELVDGEPLVFGKEQAKGITLNRGHLEVVKLGGGVTEKDLLVHRENDPDPGISYMLARMSYPDFPVALGVFHGVRRPTYEELLWDQVAEAKKGRGEITVDELLRGGECWEIE